VRGTGRTAAGEVEQQSALVTAIINGEISGNDKIICVFDCQQICQQRSNKGAAPEYYRSFRWLISSLDQGEKTCKYINVSGVISVICVLAGVWDKKVQQAKVRCACPIPTSALKPSAFCYLPLYHLQ
jgi:hypothetical protein